MLKIILQDPHYRLPRSTNAARDLRIMNKPLWLNQRDVLAPYTDRELELPSGSALPANRGSLPGATATTCTSMPLTSRPSWQRRKNATGPCRAAFPADDPAFREHALPLSTSYTPGRQPVPGRPVVFPGRHPADMRLDCTKASSRW